MPDKQPSIGPAMPGTAQPPIDPSQIKRGEMAPPISIQSLLSLFGGGAAKAAPAAIQGLEQSAPAVAEHALPAALGPTLGASQPEFAPVGGEAAVNALRSAGKPVVSGPVDPYDAWLQAAKARDSAVIQDTMNRVSRPTTIDETGFRGLLK